MLPRAGPRVGLLTSVLASARALRVPTKISMMAGPTTTGRRTLYDDVTQTIGNVRAMPARPPGSAHALFSRGRRRL